MSVSPEDLAAMLSGGGVSPEDLAASLTDDLAPDFTAEYNPAEAFAASAGRGIMSGIRGIRIIGNRIVGDTEEANQLIEQGKEESRLFAPLDERFPVATTAGQITGEIASTLPLGLGAAGAARVGASRLLPQVSKLAARVSRFAPPAAAGIAEGGIIGASKDSTAVGAGVGGAAGVALEAVLPRIGKVVKKLFNKPLQETDIRFNTNAESEAEAIIQLSPALDNLMKEAGIDQQQLLKVAQQLDLDLDKMTPQQIINRAVFEDIGVTPAGRSRVTQMNDDFAREMTLSRDTMNTTQTDIVREALFQEQKGFQDAIRRIETSTGGDADAVTRMKDALIDIHEHEYILPKREAYREIGKIAKQINDPDLINLAPLYREKVVNAVDSSLADFTGLSLSKSKPIDAVLAKFGLIGEVKSSTPRATKILIEGADGAADTITIPKGVTPLTIANSDDFRRQILANFSTMEPAEREAARRISGAIDSTIDDVVGQFEKIDGMPADVLKQVRKARSLARREKVTFNQKDLVQDLVSFKRGALDNPTIAASEVFGRINKARPEDINKFRGIMLSTQDGAEAWANHQAATIANILSDALNSGSKVASPLTGDAIHAMTFTSLKRAIDKAFKDKSGDALSAVFKDRPDVIRQLKQIQKALRLTEQTSTSVPRGSLDAVNKLISMMGRSGNALKDVASFVQVKSKARSDLKASMNLRPSMQEIKEYIEFSMPRFAAEYFGSGVSAQQATERQQ